MHADIVTAFRQRHAAALDGLDLTIDVTRLEGMEREAFAISATRKDTRVEVRLAVADDRAVRWGLNALRAWLRDGADEPLEARAAPDFRWRGVIEGFYGNPWTHEQRRRGLEWFGDFGMNLFLLAPKDAAWQRLRWREPFAPAFLDDLAELVDAGRRHGVDVSACVSPGLSVQYSSDADVVAVVAKFQQMAAVGASHFGLLLDDIPDTLDNESDRAAYASVAHAHADFANRVLAALVAQMPSAHLILCPMHYAGRGNEPYLQVMGDRLQPRIDLMWTGREICSAYLDIADAVVFERTTLRPPFYWDNYPVNDGSMARRLHVGPYHGREARLHRYSAGLLANPMELFEASLLPLGTVGAYLWDTDDYDPWVAWERVLADLVVDVDDRNAMRAFLRNALGLTGAWAPGFNEYLAASETARRAGRPQEAARLTWDHARGIRSALERIHRSDFSAPALRTEIQPWLAKYALGADVLDGVASVLERCWVDAAGVLAAPVACRDELVALRHRLGTDPHLLFGDGFDMLLFTLLAEVEFADALLQ